ncbi:uncharacterized protein LOC111829499 [Capsella rubella]|uniref:uncharacterized protein LOC111829499 n=1 Tax=Capsella rubella TaxID=81985 RepID=UPI000CD5168D|nr:uncharacterized protein LOC111829499 [Capsella rubella]
MSGSSHSLPNVDRIKFDDADCGIPIVCFCGGRAQLEPSMKRTNPGRLYYTCPNRDDGECHIWKWWDEAIVQELTSLRQEIHEYPTMNQMRETLLVHRDEISHLYNLLSENENEMARLKVLIEKKSDGISMELKNTVVAAFVVLAIIVYMFK